MHVVAQGVKLTGGETVNDKVDRRPEPRQTSLPPQEEEGGEIPWRGRGPRRAGENARLLGGCFINPRIRVAAF